MKISTKGRYALRMLIDLSMHKEEGYVSLKDVAERQGISKKYLEQIVPLLSRTGMLKANRGYQGGYALAKPASEYTVADILTLTEGSLAPIACLESDENDCPRAAECITLPVWKGMYETILNYLGGITLQDIIDSYGSSQADNYVI